MSKQVMTQALEALEYHREQTRAIPQSDAAIAALKEAIKHSCEPVAWRWKHERGAITKLEPTAKDVVNWEPLYTAAPSIPAGWQLVATEFIDAVFDNLISSDSADHYRELMLSAAPSE